jgi:predicted RNA-binding protein
LITIASDKDNRCAVFEGLVEVKYWICTLSEENWRVVQEKGVLGVPNVSLSRMMRVEPNDLLVLSVVKSKPLRRIVQTAESDVTIHGIFRAVSEPFESEEDIGFKPYVFATIPNIPLFLYWRVKIEPHHVKELTLLQVARHWRWPEARLIVSWRGKSPGQVFAVPGNMEELPEDFFQSIMNQFLPTDRVEPSPSQLKYCTSCGTGIPAGAVFCPKCGRRVQ